MRIETRWLKESIPYTGVELRPHYLLEKLKLQGSAVAAFAGPCQVKTEHLVDWEDRLEGDFIQAKSMLHFLGEFFGLSLAEGVLYQRLFTAIAGEEIERTTGEKIRREGDDLFWTAKGGGKPAKLSVSIVTASPVSCLLHFGINLDSEGAPVLAAGLYQLGLRQDAATQEVQAVRGIAERILHQFEAETRSIEWACAKVRPVV